MADPPPRLNYHRYTPHPEGATSDLRSAAVEVTCNAAAGAVPPLWAAVGYDEINYTYTRRGRHLLAELRRSSPHPFYVRTHYLFCSGTGLSIHHWGSGNVYQEDEQGRAYYDYTISDQVFDAITGTGNVPLVELGFTPRKLVDPELLAGFPYQNAATLYTRYEAGGWAYPPKDYDRWSDLVGSLVAHCVERYGRDEVSQWLWELWNEPDIFYWRGTEAEFHRLYEVTAAAVRAALPTANVGGPATTGDPSGPAFLRGFLRYCADRDLPADFVSFHTKGSYLTPSRVYGPVGGPPPELQSPSSLKMLREVRDSLEVIASFPEFRDVPAIVDECDASVPAHLGRYDNANYGYRNTAYFPAFQSKLMKKLLDLNEVSGTQVAVAMIWGFYFEGTRYFEGMRTLLTAGGIEKPVLNAYRMFGKLHARRLAASSNAAWDLSRLDDGEPGMAEEVDALATSDGADRIAVLLWRSSDDQYLKSDGDTRVTVTLTGLQHATGTAAIRQWRVDRDHSNSHSAWLEMGSPAEPSDAQLSILRSRSGLETIGELETMAWRNGQLTVEVALPLPSVALLEVDLAAGVGD